MFVPWLVSRVRAITAERKLQYYHMLRRFETIITFPRLYCRTGYRQDFRNQNAVLPQKFTVFCIG